MKTFIQQTCERPLPWVVISRGKEPVTWNLGNRRMHTKWQGTRAATQITAHWKSWWSAALNLPLRISVEKTRNLGSWLHSFLFSKLLRKFSQKIGHRQNQETWLSFLKNPKTFCLILFTLWYPTGTKDHFLKLIREDKPLVNVP